MSYDKEQALAAEIKALVEAEGTSQAIIETPASEVAPVPEIEKQARELGWKSKEERTAEGKDNTHYVSPEEYVSRKPLFVRLDKQGEELRRLKEMQRQNSAHMAKVRQEAYDQALRDLESRQDRAVAEADTMEYQRLKAQTKAVEQQRQQDPIVNNPEIRPVQDPAVAEFAERNASWYNISTKENAKMAAAAAAVDNFLAKQAEIDGRPIDPRSHLAAIESEVKRLFPHRFEQPVAPIAPVVAEIAPTAPSVGRSTAPVTPGRSSINLAARLSPVQKQLGEKFQASNPEYTLEKYAQELESMGRLGK